MKSKDKLMDPEAAKAFILSLGPAKPIFPVTPEPWCAECDGTGRVDDNIWRCGDPDCCGSPGYRKCTACENTWEYGDD